MTLKPFRAEAGFDATDKKGIRFADPTKPTDVVNLQYLARHAGVNVAGRTANLPTPSSKVERERPADGDIWLVRFDTDGNPLDRLYYYVKALEVKGPVSEVVIDVALEDMADVAAMGTAGTSYPNIPLDEIGDKGAVIQIVPRPDGTAIAGVQSGGTDYHVGDSQLIITGIAGITKLTARVSKILGSAPLSGWIPLNIRNFTKGVQLGGDHNIANELGDIETITEQGKEELKVWTGTAWHSIVATEQIKNWIAALSLFKGTVEGQSDSLPGAVKFAALPDLTALTTAKDLQYVSNYWTFVGAANTQVHSEWTVTGLTGATPGVYPFTVAGNAYIARVPTATTAFIGSASGSLTGLADGATVNIPAAAFGTGSSAATFAVPKIADVATPIVGTDLNGLLLNPGDWVQVSNAGTAAAPNLKWVSIGGDLLSKARGDMLYGLNSWSSGSYERGTVVNHNGQLWKSTTAVVPTDNPPSPPAEVNTAAFTFTDPVALKYVVTIDSVAPQTYTPSAPGLTASGAAAEFLAWFNAVAAFQGIATAKITSSAPPLTTITLSGKTPTQVMNVDVTYEVTGGTTAQLAITTGKAPYSSPWTVIRLAGGVKKVDDDTKLQALTGMTSGDVALVLSSARNGGAATLFSYDGGSKTWIQLSSPRGNQMDLRNGDLIYPDILHWDGKTPAAPADGLITNDLLVNDGLNVLQRWNGTAWSPVQTNSPGQITPEVVGTDRNGPSIDTTGMRQIYGSKCGTLRQWRYTKDKTTNWVLYVGCTGAAAGDSAAYAELVNLNVSSQDHIFSVAHNKTLGWSGYYYTSIGWDNHSLRANTWGMVQLDYVVDAQDLFIVYKITGPRQTDGLMAYHRGTIQLTVPKATIEFNQLGMGAFTGEGLTKFRYF